jgi:argininosuccinate lyase
VPIDRRHTAATLGFASLYANSLDAVSDRDFAVEFMAAASLVMVHLSRLSEEVILWASEEFAFVALTDRCATGSSLMPQKKNPDVPELVRGKSGRVFGHLMGLLTMIKGLPLAYNKDFQEDKEAVFDGVRTCLDSLEAMAILVWCFGPNGWRRPWRQTSPMRPMWPTTWWPAGCRSARPTSWWVAW